MDWLGCWERLMEKAATLLQQYDHQTGMGAALYHAFLAMDNGASPEEACPTASLTGTHLPCCS